MTNDRQHPTTARPEAPPGTVWPRFAVEFAFPVSFTHGLFEPDDTLFRDTLARPEPARRHRFVAFIDDGVLDVLPEIGTQVREYARVHAEHLELVGNPVVVPGGEAVKTDPSFVERLRRVLFDRHVDRHSYVVGIGGGAMLDALGLVAATAHRGIRHVRVPSTVLAQNDSGVGVKNGVNLFGQKNHVGTFAPPFAVLNDHDFITVLPARDKVAGMAEAVKVALIRDGEFFRWLEANAHALADFDDMAMRQMIERCAGLHMHQIGQGDDPFEHGSARPLDYGHWSAHRLETLTDHRLRHGEAVAIGLALDARYSVLSGLLDAGEEERVCALLERLGFTLRDPALRLRHADGRHEILQGLADFREHLGGELTITLLAALGRGVEVHAMDEARVLACIDWLDRRAERIAA